MRYPGLATLVLVLCASTASAVQPATTRAAEPMIELRTGAYLARIEVRTTITEDGVVRRIRVTNKSYGPGDIDPKRQQIETRQGRLTPEQRAHLLKLFQDWESLKPRYGGVADGPEYRLRYKNKTVEGGSETPPEVREIANHIDAIARTMPVVEK